MISVLVIDDHEVNKEINWEGILPNSSEELMLTFTMQKKWGINPETKADFFFLEYAGDTVIKHKLPLNY